MPQSNADTPLGRLTARLKDDLAAVNRCIIDRMDSNVPLIPEVATYIVASGGKRIRPLLLLAAARMCGYGGDQHIGLAASVEFIHTATLLHDDVIDESDMRRGKATANEVFGNKPSVLVGDFLFARAFQLMTDSDSMEVLRVLSYTSTIITEGEVLQLSAEHDLGTTKKTYEQVIRGKTAELFSAACRVGGLIAEQAPSTCDALGEYGLRLGLAFQLVDDALDYSASQETLGKAVGDDFHEGKITFPIMLAFDDGDADERAFWRRTIGQGDIQDGDLAHATDLLGRHRALERTLDEARRHGTAARAALATLPDHPMREDLDGLIDFTIERDH